MATEQLQVVLNAVWRGKAAVQQAKKDIGGIDKEAAKGGMSLGKLAIAAGAATVAIGATAAAAKVAWDTFKDSAALKTASNQFDVLAESVNSTSDAMLGKLREATNGMMTDAQLMAGASQIMSLGLAKTEKDVVRLATVVGGLGLDMQQVILTFANDSTMRLDALGLSVEEVTAKVRALEAQGFEGDAFDQAVLLSLEERWRTMGGAIDETTIAIQTAEAAWANWVDARKLGFAATAGDIIVQSQKEADAMNILTEALERGLITGDEYWLLQGQLAAANYENVDAVDQLAGKLEELHKIEGIENASAGGRAKSRRDAAAAARDEAFAVRELADAMGTLLSMTPSGNYSGDIAYDTRAAAIDKVKSIPVSGNYSGGDEYDKFIQKAAVVTSQATRASGAVGRAAGGFGAYKSAAEQAADAMQELSAETGNFFEKARQTDEFNPAQVLYDMAKAAGASAKELADLGVAGGLFSAEEAAQDLNEAFLMQNAQQLGAMVAGGMAPEEALASLMDMQGQIEANQGLAEEFFAEVDGATAETSMALDTNPAQTEFDTFAADLAAQGVTVPLRFSTSGAAAAVAPAGVGGGYVPGFARGGSFVVPPGYPNDSYLMAVTSDEHVEVTPRGQQRNNTGGNITINNYDRQSAALNATIIGLHRRAAILS